MNNTQIDKLKKFANDDVMNGAVYQMLLDSFLKEKGGVNPTDVQILAAERLAVSFLKGAWKELSKFKSDVKGEEPIHQQIGL